MDAPSNERLIYTKHEAEIAKAVMKYLAEFPEAMDNVKGIADWWLIRRNVKAEIEDLSRVLDYLTAQGLLERIGGGEGTRYRLRKMRR